jgi:acyl carrier protein
MNIREQVVETMRGVGFREENLTDEMSLVDDLGIDSTELVEIIVALEKHFSIQIDIDREGPLNSFGELVSCVNRIKSVPA